MDYDEILLQDIERREREKKARADDEYQKALDDIRAKDAEIARLREELRTTTAPPPRPRPTSSKGCKVCGAPRVEGRTLCAEHLAEFMEKPFLERLGRDGIAALVIIFVVSAVIVVAVALFDTEPSDDGGGWTGGDAVPNTVYVAVYNTHAPGYVDIYADGKHAHTMYLENGESDGYHYTVGGTVKFRAVHEDGFDDSDSGGPGDSLFLTV